MGHYESECVWLAMQCANTTAALACSRVSSLPLVCVILTRPLFISDAGLAAEIPQVKRYMDGLVSVGNSGESLRIPADELKLM